MKEQTEVFLIKAAGRLLQQKQEEEEEKGEWGRKRKERRKKWGGGRVEEEVGSKEEEEGSFSKLREGSGRFPSLSSLHSFPDSLLLLSSIRRRLVIADLGYFSNQN